MLKGHTFNLQTFTSEAFALFIDKFLNGKCGVIKGCNMSNTTNTATISDGYFVVRGRFLQVISQTTVTNITADGFYSLICEIDLRKTNTTDKLNQAEIKAVSNANNYPELTQQDITGDGKVYQYEFARFKVESGSITNFTDRRTYVELEGIFDDVEAKTQEFLNELQEALADVLDGSAYVLKADASDIVNLKYEQGDTAPTDDLDADLYDQYF